MCFNIAIVIWQRMPIAIIFNFCEQSSPLWSEGSGSASLKLLPVPLLPAAAAATNQLCMYPNHLPLHIGSGMDQMSGGGKSSKTINICCFKKIWANMPVHSGRRQQRKFRGLSDTQISGKFEIDSNVWKT